MNLQLLVQAQVQNSIHQQVQQLVTNVQLVKNAHQSVPLLLIAALVNIHFSETQAALHAQQVSIGF